MFVLLILVSELAVGQNSTVFVEAESFTQKGGWVVDPQFMDQMGSPFLMVHRTGKPDMTNNQNYNLGGTLLKMPK